MENIFLNLIQCISDGRFWFGPLLLGCVMTILIKTIKDTIKQ